MIELRWLERPVLRQRGIDDGFFHPPLPDYVIVRVLQYRNGEYPYQAPHETEWCGSDWTDVPTVDDQPNGP